MARIYLVVAVAWISLAAVVSAAEPVHQLKWSDLLPPVQKRDNSFVALSPGQKMDLTVVDMGRQARAQGEALSPRQVESVNAAIARLEKDNIDIDRLLASRVESDQARRQAAESVNEKLNGEHVRIPGYLLPLETDGRKVTEFLLVPYVGACIHAPTPPPNQIVHVKHVSGFEITGTFAPVWVQGVLRTVRSEPSLSLVDGTANVPVGYALDAKTVEPYRQ